MPKNIIPELLLFISGGSICFAGCILLIAKRKKLSLEVWIPLLALCIFGMIGFFAVAICLAAAFVIAS